MLLCALCHVYLSCTCIVLSKYSAPRHGGTAGMNLPCTTLRAGIPWSTRERRHGVEPYHARAHAELDRQIADPTGHALQDLCCQLHLQWFNFTRYRCSLVALMRTTNSDGPDPSCALVIPLNTGPYTSAYDIGVAEESSRDLFDLLRHTADDMAVQDFSIFWEPASRWSRSRALRPDMLMCISKQRQALP